MSEIGVGVRKDIDVPTIHEGGKGAFLLEVFFTVHDSKANAQVIADLTKNPVDKAGRTLMVPEKCAEGQRSRLCMLARVGRGSS
jgi:hypothetical protein